MVYRVYVEKKKELANEAKALLSDARNLLGINELTDVRILNRYDAENIEEIQEDEKVMKERQKMEFALFMRDIVDAVKGGSGEYIMSKEFSHGRE